MAILTVVVLGALASAGAAAWMRKRRGRPGSAKAESSLALEAGRAQGRSVARALAEGLELLGRRRWGLWGSRADRLRGFEVELRQKNASCGALAEELAARVQALDPRLRVERSEVLTLRAPPPTQEEAEPEEGSEPGRALVVTAGRVLKSVGTVRVSNHSEVPLAAAKIVCGVLARHSGPLECRMVVRF
jgi:hypothetical protein